MEIPVLKGLYLLYKRLSKSGITPLISITQLNTSIPNSLYQKISPISRWLNHWEYSPTCAYCKASNSPKSFSNLSVKVQLPRQWQEYASCYCPLRRIVWNLLSRIKFVNDSFCTVLNFCKTLYSKMHLNGKSCYCHWLEQLSISHKKRNEWNLSSQFASTLRVTCRITSLEIVLRYWRMCTNLASVNKHLS